MTIVSINAICWLQYLPKTISGFCNISQTSNNYADTLYFLERVWVDVLMEQA